MILVMVDGLVGSTGLGVHPESVSCVGVTVELREVAGRDLHSNLMALEEAIAG